MARTQLVKSIALSISLVFLAEQPGFAQGAAQLDLAGRMAVSRPAAQTLQPGPAQLRYLRYDSAKDSFRILLDKGDAQDDPPLSVADASQSVFNYFLVGLALPNDAFWVNLRPDSPEDVIDADLARTDIGRIMLETDVLLKKDTARFTSPQSGEGREYWDKLYRKAAQLYGSNAEAIPTLSRPWIVPGEVIIQENRDGAYIFKASLKVMLEQDYLKGRGAYGFDDARAQELNEYSSQLMRELIIPKVTREVNSSPRYAQLRQVFYSLVLAQWFKARYRGAQGKYARRMDQRDLSSLESKTPWSVGTYFKQYQDSFKDGEYRIKEPVAAFSGNTIRSYFSGGENLALVIGPLGAAAQEGQVTAIPAAKAPPSLPGQVAVDISGGQPRIAGRPAAPVPPPRTAPAPSPASPSPAEVKLTGEDGAAGMADGAFFGDGVVGSMAEGEGTLFETVRGQLRAIREWFTRRIGRGNAEGYAWDKMVKHLEARRSAADSQMIRDALAALGPAGIDQDLQSRMAAKVIPVNVKNARRIAPGDYLGGLVIKHRGVLKVLFPRSQLRRLSDPELPNDERRAILGDLLHEVVEVGLLSNGMDVPDAHRYALVTRSIFIRSGDRETSSYLDRLRSPFRDAKLEVSFRDIIDRILEGKGIDGRDLSTLDDRELRDILREFDEVITMMTHPAMNRLMHALITREQIAGFKREHGHFDMDDLVLALQRLHTAVENLPELGLTEESFRMFPLDKIMAFRVSEATRFTLFQQAQLAGEEFNAPLGKRSEYYDREVYEWLSAGDFGRVRARLAESPDNMALAAICAFLFIDVKHMEHNYINNLIYGEPFIERAPQARYELLGSEIRSDFIRSLELVVALLEAFQKGEEGLKVKRFVGRGNDGIVLLAERQGKEVVVKVNIPKNMSRDALKELLPFVTEVTNNDSHFARNLELISIDLLGQEYLVEVNQYVEGATLKRIASHVDLFGGMDNNISMMIQFLAVQGYLAENDLLNGDIYNLSNYVVDHDGVLQYVDFGNIIPVGLQVQLEMFMSMNRGVEPNEAAITRDVALLQKKKAIAVALRIMTGHDLGVYNAGEQWFLEDQGSFESAVGYFTSRFGPASAPVATRLFKVLARAWKEDGMTLAQATGELQQEAKAAGVDLAQARLDGVVGAMHGPDNRVKAGPYNGYGSIMRGLDERVDPALGAFVKALDKEAKSRAPGARKRVLVIGAGGGKLVYDMRERYGDAFEIVPLNKERLSVPVKEFTEYTADHIAGKRPRAGKPDKAAIEEKVRAFLPWFQEAMVLADISKSLGVPDGSFDYVLVSQQVMLYVRDKLKVVRMAKQALKPGGQAFITDGGEEDEVQVQRYNYPGEMILEHFLSELNDWEKEYYGITQPQYEMSWADSGRWGMVITNIRPDAQFPALKVLWAAEPVVWDLSTNGVRNGKKSPKIFENGVLYEQFDYKGKPLWEPDLISQDEDHAVEGALVSREDAVNIAEVADALGSPGLVLPAGLSAELERLLGPGSMSGVSLVVVPENLMLTRDNRKISRPIRLGSRIFVGSEYFAGHQNDPRSIIADLGHEAMSLWVAERRPDLKGDEAHELAQQFAQVAELSSPGGIDFRSMPIVIQASASIKAGLDNAAAARLKAVPLAQEWKEIEGMEGSGISPSSQRLMEYVQASYAQGVLARNAGDILSLLARIFRQEERESVNTDPGMRDILVVLQSGL